MVYSDGHLLLPYVVTTLSNATGSSSSGEDDPGGMFLRRNYDLGIHPSSSTTTVQQPQLLEILVLPPPSVGKPTSSIVNNTIIDGMEDGQGGDHILAQSGAIVQYTAGWDWIHSTPDRNVGIWDNVVVDWIDGDVRLHDLRVTVGRISSGLTTTTTEGEEKEEETLLPLGDDKWVSAWVDLSLTATLHDLPQQSHQQSHDDDGWSIMGELEYRITPMSDPTLLLVTGTVRNVSIQQSVSVHHIERIYLGGCVQLWWPHTHSSRRRQPLYSVNVTFRSYPPLDGRDSISSHEADIHSTFGVRTISYFIHPITKSLAVKVNGHPIFLTGGNWITTDQFLRYSTNHRRYLHELTLLRHVGINAVRVWGGGITKTDLFYDTADVLGMLVYQEFWMTGDNNGRMAGSYDWPVDHGAYLANVRDVIVRLRNHPCLFLYAGGNELFTILPPSSSLLPLSSSSSLSTKQDVMEEEGESSGTSPPRDIEYGLKLFFFNLDNNLPYVTSSVTDVVDAFDNTMTLGKKLNCFLLFQHTFFS